MNSLGLALWTLVVGCAGEPESAKAPTDPAPAPAPQPSGPIRELALLEQGPPAAGGFGRALTRVASEVGAGVVRCPLGGGGKVQRRHGTPRDQSVEGSLLLLMEVDPASEPSWHPVFETVVGEDQWVTLLAVPGSTTAFVATARRTLEYTFPPAVAGQSVTCTGVREVTWRTVKGTVRGEHPQNTFPVPCLANPPRVADDGTFVIDIPTPCTLWVETADARSEKLQVPPGDAPLEATFTMAPDPLRNADLTWTRDGVLKVGAHLDALEKGVTDTTALVDRLGPLFADDAAATKVLKQWKYELWEWKVRVDSVRRSLGN